MKKILKLMKNEYMTVSEYYDLNAHGGTGRRPASLLKALYH